MWWSPWSALSCLRIPSMVWTIGEASFGRSLSSQMHPRRGCWPNSYCLSVFSKWWSWWPTLSAWVCRCVGILFFHSCHSWMRWRQFSRFLPTSLASQWSRFFARWCWTASNKSSGDCSNLTKGSVVLVLTLARGSFGIPFHYSPSLRAFTFMRSLSPILLPFC